MLTHSEREQIIREALEAAHVQESELSLEEIDALARATAEPPEFFWAVCWAILTPVLERRRVEAVKRWAFLRGLVNSGRIGGCDDGRI